MISNNMNIAKVLSVVLPGLLTVGLVKFLLTFALVAWPLSVAVGGLVAFLVFTNYDKLVKVFTKAATDVTTAATSAVNEFKQ